MLTTKLRVLIFLGLTTLVGAGSGEGCRRCERDNNSGREYSVMEYCGKGVGAAVGVGLLGYTLLGMGARETRGMGERDNEGEDDLEDRD